MLLYTRVNKPNSSPSWSDIVSFLKKLTYDIVVTVIGVLVVSILGALTAIFTPSIYTPLIDALEKPYTFSGFQLILLCIVLWLALPRIFFWLKRKIRSPIFNSKIKLGETQQIGSEGFGIRLDSIGLKKQIDTGTEAFPATFSIINKEDGRVLLQENLFESGELPIRINQITYWLVITQVVPDKKKENNWAVFEIKRLG